MHNKIKLLTAVAITLASADIFAAQQTLVGTFQTIKAVTLSETTPLALVGLNLPSGSACDLTASADGTGTNYLGDQAMRIGNAANANALGTAVTTMAGAGCLVSTGAGAAFGLYEIDGAAGATVNITIVNGSNADLTLVPSGCAAFYNAGPNLDTCVAVSQAAGSVPIRLAGPTDTGTLGEGTPIAGKSLIALGGLATAARTLTAGTPYTVDFTINVAY
jgi:hypothetical protein